MQTKPLLGVKVITMVNKETTSTNSKNGDEEYKCTGSQTNPDVREVLVNHGAKYSSSECK